MSFRNDPAPKSAKQSNNPKGTKNLVTKVKNSRALPSYVPGIRPTGWPHDKCIKWNPMSL